LEILELNLEPVQTSLFYDQSYLGGTSILLINLAAWTQWGNTITNFYLLLLKSYMSLLLTVWSKHYLYPSDH